MNTAATPIPCAGSQLLEARHVCAFFHNLDEEYRVLLPFIRDGFASGDRAFHVVDPKLREEHLRRLSAAGIDAAESEPTGQLKLCDWHAAHLQTTCAPGSARRTTPGADDCGPLQSR